MRSTRLVILDCDRTLWDHEDVSSMELPFSRASRDVLVDARGDVLRLHEGAREFLELAKARGVALAVASWNLEEHVLEALRALGILELFDVVVAEFHPRKEEMVRRVFSELRRRGLEVSEGEAAYVDDSREAAERVRLAFPKLRVIVYGADVRDFWELSEALGLKNCAT